MNLEKLPNDVNNSINDMTADIKLILVNQYDLFAGFPKRIGQLKNWQGYLYQVYGITKLDIELDIVTKIQ